MEQFIELVKERMSFIYGDSAVISIQELRKNNDVTLTALMIRPSGSNVGVTITLDSCYEDYKKGRSITDICTSIKNTVEQNKNADIEENVNCLKDFNQVKDKICFKIINRERNAELLKSVPHQAAVEDFAIVPFISISTDKDYSATILIKNDMLKLWNVSKADVFYCMWKNTPNIKKPIIQTLYEMMRNLTAACSEEVNEADFELPMYVASNEDHVFGASVIFYPGLLQKFSKQINSNFYILPSSIHEALLLKSDEPIDADGLKDLVMMVNKTELYESEFLSDNVYWYDRKTDTISRV